MHPADRECLPRLKHHPQRRRLGEAASRVLVVAYREDVGQLQQFLEQEGFLVQQVRKRYSEVEMRYPAVNRCLLSHRDAWNIAKDLPDWTIIVEADFVPCLGFGLFPLPFSESEPDPKIGWLYSVGPVVYHEDDSGGFFGHNAGTVAYILNSVSAQCWLRVFDEWTDERSLDTYGQFEVIMPIYLRHRYGVRLYISPKSYGEHGGLANPEHAWLGYRAWHQADSLQSPLAFLPAYAQGSQLRYLLIRLRSRLRYVYKFLHGKYFDSWKTYWKLPEPRLRKLRFAFRRAFL
jgi:hypothetical protein